MTYTSLDQPSRCPTQCTQRHCRWAQEGLHNRSVRNLWKIPWEGTETIGGFGVCVGCSGCGGWWGSEPLSSLGGDVCGEVLCPAGCGHVPAPEQTMPACFAQQVKTLLWRLCHGVGMWCGVKDWAVFYRGVCRALLGMGGEGCRALFHVQEHSSLSLSVCGRFVF